MKREMKMDVKSGEIFYDIGFNLGNDEEEFAEKPILNNHYDIHIRCVTGNFETLPS